MALSQPGPSSPGRTEGEAAEVLNLSPTQHRVPGLGAATLHSRQAPVSPKVTHVYSPPPGCPGLTQSSPQRHTQPRILATAGGRLTVSAQPVLAQAHLPRAA